jgi:hypothetical protein
MEEYLEKVILAKAQLEQTNRFLMNVVSFLVRDFELPWDFTAAQLATVPGVNIKSEDGMVYTVTPNE